MSFNLRENYIGNVYFMSTILFFRLGKLKKVMLCITSFELFIGLMPYFYSLMTSFTVDAMEATLSKLLGRKILVALPSAILAKDS